MFYGWSPEAEITGLKAFITLVSAALVGQGGTLTSFLEKKQKAQHLTAGAVILILPTNRNTWHQLALP